MKKTGLKLGLLAVLLLIGIAAAAAYRSGMMSDTRQTGPAGGVLPSGESILRSIEPEEAMKMLESRKDIIFL
jgi:hypothetical protein